MENDLILSREAELKAKQVRLQEQLATIEKELYELDVAKGVLARLSGLKQSHPRAAPSNDSMPSAKPARKNNKSSRKKPGGLPTIKAMVLAALEDAKLRGLPGLRPKGIRDFVAARYNFEMGSSANTIPSRMWRDENLIVKDTESGLFSIPSKENPADVVSSQEASTGLVFNPAQVRGAGPGGGP